MKKTMEYKGYTGTVEYSEKDDCLWGRVIGITDIISYEGQSISEIRQDFQDMIDWYFEDCKARGKEPDKPFLGNVLININPVLQAKLEQQAMDAGLSFNELISVKLAEI